METTHHETHSGGHPLPWRIKQTRMGYLHDYVVAFFLLVGAIVLFVFQPITFINYVIIGLIGLAVFLILMVELHITSSTLVIDHDKVLLSHGIMSRSESSAAFQNVADFHTHQNIHERMFGYGTLTINTSGGKQPLEFHKVKHPHKVCDALLKLAHTHTMNVKGGSHDASTHKNHS